jgi:hypothetical protein
VRAKGACEARSRGFCDAEGHDTDDLLVWRPDPPAALAASALTGARGRDSTGEAMRQKGSSWEVHHGGRDGHATGPPSCVIGEVTGRR